MKKQRKIIFGSILTLFLFFHTGFESFPNTGNHNFCFENPSSPGETQKFISIEMDSHQEDQLNTSYIYPEVSDFDSRRYEIRNDCRSDSLIPGIWVPPEIS